MLFNSLEFALFLPLVFGLFWAIPAERRHLRNAVLLAASYVFYAWWDWRFLGLIALSSAVDFIAAARIASTRRVTARRAWLGVSLSVNLGMLGVLKYYDFFAATLSEAAASVGWTVQPVLLDLVLPVGISFYTFQTLSYTLDVYRRQMRPSREPLAFFTFVAFFPQLVAGPIERARSLLPQFESPRQFDPVAARGALRQILWGLFKKIAVADTAAVAVDEVFARPGACGGGTLLVAAVLFSFQIYGDFSGYSDIAIGTARLFGFRLMRNFDVPYFSRSIAEFWRRWHISLSTWFRDYVYIPMGGNRVSRARRVANVVVVFLVSGLWHGANWTFVAWGAIHALCFLPSLVAKSMSRRDSVVAAARHFPRVGEAVSMAITFGIVSLAWVFFRADSISAAGSYLTRLVSQPLSFEGLPRLTLGPIAGLVAFEWVHRERAHGLDLRSSRTVVRWTIYLVLIWTIVRLHGAPRPFVYFQF